MGGRDLEIPPACPIMRTPGWVYVAMESFRCMH